MPDASRPWANAHGGCTSMGGAYTIDGDRLKTTQMAMTDMACNEPRMQQDDWLARLLGDVALTLVGDTLTCQMERSR